jgi:hypothetical protein
MRAAVIAVKNGHTAVVRRMLAEAKSRRTRSRRLLVSDST